MSDSSEQPLGSALWLSPTWRAADEVRDRLLGDGLAACLGPAVMTFGRFAEAVLAGTGEDIRPLSPLMKRELLRQALAVLAAAGRLKHFAPIAHTSGQVDLVAEFITELKRLEIWPEQFLKACQARGLTLKDTELLEL